MSDSYEVGYGKPPPQHQFKPGNQVAKGRKRKKKEGLSIPEILGRAMSSKRKIKRGGEIIDMPVAEILVERVVQAMTSGSTRDLALIIGLLERYSPGLLASDPEPFKVTYERGKNSNVELPSADLWEPER